MGMSRPDGRRGEAERGGACTRQVLDQHVGARAQGVDPVRRVGADGHAALVRVPVEEGQRAVGRGDVAGEGRAVPSDVATVELDLEHVGAEVGEDARRQGTPHVSQIDDMQMGERAGHPRSLPERRSAGKVVVRRGAPALASDSVFSRKVVTVAHG
jgi:hypothetical protein